MAANLKPQGFVEDNDEMCIKESFAKSDAQQLKYNVLQEKYNMLQAKYIKLHIDGLEQRLKSKSKIQSKIPNKNNTIMMLVFVMMLSAMPLASISFSSSREYNAN